MIMLMLSRDSKTVCVLFRFLALLHWLGSSVQCSIEMVKVDIYVPDLWW